MLGTGLLKGNVSVIVGQLYGADDVRRDAGFSIFYMGINLGAFIAPLVCGYLGQRVNWHLGFAAAGVGMVLGLIQYVLGRQVPRRRRHCSPAPAESPEAAARAAKRTRCSSAAVCSRSSRSSRSAATRASLPITADADRRRRRLLPARCSSSGSSAGCSSSADWTPEERKRLYVIGVLFLAAALFWSVFEQAGSTLNLFADRNTDNVGVRLELPEQLVPVAELAVHHRARAGVRVAVDPARPRRKEPSSPAKFAIGLVLRRRSGSRSWSSAARLAETGVRVSPMWLIAHLPAAHVRRAVAEPGRPERDDQARAGAHRRA